MVNNTPPINATGTYTVATPFTLVDGAVYRAEAIRGFNTLEVDEIDIFASFYEPVGLTVNEVEADRTNDINIITLMSDTAPTAYIPSSYILSFPTETTVPYSRILLSVDLGLLPDGIILTTAIEEIVSALEDIVGVGATARVHALSNTDGVSWSEHTMLEGNRKARVKSTETAVAAVKRLTTEISKVSQLNQQLMDSIVELRSRL